MRKASKLGVRTRSKASAAKTRKPVKLDETDLLILSMLQENARVPNVDIARRARMVPSGILVRLRKLEENKIILSYETRLNSLALGLGLTAFVFVKAKEVTARGDTAKRLAAIPEVQEVHNITGEDCYLVKIRVVNPQELGRVLREQVGRIPSVFSTKTTIVLDTFKETTALPIAKQRALVLA
jgi:Lrp/AsnC family leucine-responsive transcriptional regulator